MAVRKFRICALAVFAATLSIIHIAAAADKVNCAPEDKSCLFSMLDRFTGQIDETSWRDQTLREYAKLLARDKRETEAVAVIGRIENPDTKAMTIRGIGMQAAKTDMTPEEFRALFAALRAEAEKIKEPPSYAIALTYIAMAQVFAHQDADAMKTAADMKNSSLRNKAYNESAKIQADRGDLDLALASIAAIDSPIFRDKAHYTIAKILANAKRYGLAQQAALKIGNPYQRAQAVLHILASQITPEEKQVTPDDAIGAE
jgi:hypothetical protein